MGLKKMINNGAMGGLGIKRRTNFEQIRENTSFIKRITLSALSLSMRKTPPLRETFEECVARLQLTEEDISRRMSSSKQIVFCLLGLCALVGGYMIYLFCIKQYLSVFLCLVLLSVLFSYTFREHFNYFQMKQRRLGCTLAQWFKCTFLGR